MAALGRADSLPLRTCAVKREEEEATVRQQTKHGPLEFPRSPINGIHGLVSASSIHLCLTDYRSTQPDLSFRSGTGARQESCSCARGASSGPLPFSPSPLLSPSGLSRTVLGRTIPTKNSSPAYRHPRSIPARDVNGRVASRPCAWHWALAGLFPLLPSRLALAWLPVPAHTHSGQRRHHVGSCRPPSHGRPAAPSPDGMTDASSCVKTPRVCTATPPADNVVVCACCCCCLWFARYVVFRLPAAASCAYLLSLPGQPCAVAFLPPSSSCSCVSSVHT